MPAGGVSVEQQRPETAREAKLSPGDLAELMSTFSAATEQLQATHVRLQSEVQRLRTELVDTKTQLRRAQELAALGEMAAGIAHEIRNPLGSIKLYCSALVEDLDELPAQQGMAKRVAGAVDRLNAVVGDVLAFSRELRVQTMETSAHVLLNEALESCEGERDRLGVRIERTYRERADAVVWCDPTLMRQALVNVVRNALEAASEASGERVVALDFEARTVLGSNGARDAMVGLRISDSGPGVPEEVRRRMFVPFFTTREAGTGLGLAIVHRILDAHGGRVDIAGGDAGSALPGAVVELLLPALPVSEHEAHGEAA